MNKGRISIVCTLAVITALAMAVPQSATAADASLPYHPSTVLVSFDAGISGVVRDAAHASIGGRVANTMDWMNLDVVRLPDGVDPAVAATHYRALPGVSYAGVNKKIKALSAPNDLLFADQWGFHNTGQSVKGSLVRGVADADIDAPEGWTAAFGSGAFESTGGTRVAVLDTGIDRGHVDLLNKVKACANATTAVGVVVNGSCDDDGAHGTHTAGTVAANSNNTAGVAGTAPNAELAIFKFLNAGGVGFLADEIAGIRWAVTTGQAKVLSMSFGSYEPDDAEQQALKDALAANVLPISASGNDYDTTKNYPAYYPEVMSVASSNAADAISDFTSCNNDVEIAAPGEDIWSTAPGNAYAVLSGTSMATPHVAGAAALVISEKGFTATQTRSLLKNSAVPVANNTRNECNGYDRLNLAAALGGGSTPPPPPGPGAIAGTVTAQKAGAIAAATVNCGPGGTATTASNGTYSLTNVPSGSYTCTASKTGYTSKTSSVTVNSGVTSTLDFVLRAERTTGGKSNGK